MRHVTRSRPLRRGAAILLCLFAATVVGMAAVAIFRTHHAGARRIEAIESFRVAQWSSRGAVHRAVARLRQDKNFRGTLPDLGPESSLQVQSLVTIADHNGKIAIQAKSTYRHAAATYALELDPSKI